MNGFRVSDANRWVSDRLWLLISGSPKVSRASLRVTWRLMLDKSLHQVMENIRGAPATDRQTEGVSTNSKKHSMSLAHKELCLPCEFFWPLRHHMILLVPNESVSRAFKTSALSIIYASLNIWNAILFLYISSGPYSMCSTQDMWHGIVRWLSEDMGTGCFSEQRAQSKTLLFLN